MNLTTCQKKSYKSLHSYNFGNIILNVASESVKLEYKVVLYVGKNKSIYKAILLGCIPIPFNSYWVVTIEMGRYLAYPTCISLFFNVVFTLFVLQLLSLILVRLLPRLAFTSHDLLIIYTMLSIASGISGLDMM